MSQIVQWPIVHQPYMIFRGNSLFSVGISANFHLWNQEKIYHCIQIPSYGKTVNVSIIGNISHQVKNACEFYKIPKRMCDDKLVQQGCNVIMEW